MSVTKTFTDIYVKPIATPASYLSYESAQTVPKKFAGGSLPLKLLLS